MPPAWTYKVQNDGREVIVSGNGECLKFSVSGPLRADTTSCEFAVWALLPIAMRQGNNLHIEGCGDPLICENAERLSRVWETWMPHTFSRVSVCFDTYSTQPCRTNTDLVLYSGGVDSTHNMLCRHHASKRQSLLTIQGMDYGYDDDERFAALVTKTAAFARSISPERLFVKHNLYPVYRRYKIATGVSHGFALASSAFLFSRHFALVEIAADHTRAQEYLVHPWGTNSLTNPLFSGTEFKFSTANLELTRCDKLPLIAQSHLALGALTFCKDRKFRPENCGRCKKCVRTKAMFMASIGYIPNGICANSSLSDGMLDNLRLKNKNERSSLLELFLAARERGILEQIPGLAQKAQFLIHEARPRRVQRFSGPLEAIARRLGLSKASWFI